MIARTNLFKIIAVLMLAAMLVVGTAATGCSNGAEPNGGDNGDEPNGGSGEPDFSAGTGLIIDCDQGSGEDPEAGDQALDFRFQDSVGATFSLSDFRGTPVMLNFWTTRCSHCQAEMPYLLQLYEQGLADREVVMLTVNVGEDAETVNTFIEAWWLSFPVLLDMEKELKTQYRVTGLPRTFFIDSQGTIRGIKRGDFASLEEIEDALDQLMALEGN